MAIASLLRQSVTVSNPAGPDVHNKQSWSAAKVYPARFEQTYKIIANATQEQVPIVGIVYLAPDANVQLGAKLNYLGTDYRVTTVQPMTNSRGKTHHLEAMVQNWNTE